ncbi:type II secretion system protein [Prosthecobacter sp.]|uniref:type II secretion system protein n=1 Tax=Prosthecobacter sp. TaxID=1965333 RepID=UPI002ABC6969|nr:type II secretion system protein [Prosthecobacter sp.]MDZ4406339.1 type II secretion system protein [Prosthecobacter sp.]
MITSTHRGTCLRNSASLPRRRERGFSVTELVVTISIMGVLAGITVGSFNQFLGGAKDALAEARQEMLNQALHRFAQQNYEMLFNAMDSATADEMVILRTLQYRDTNLGRAKIGSPYMDPRYNPLSSSSTTLYRLRWTGRMYELLKPGQSGTGLLMNFEGTDFTTAFVFPPNFQMAGR